MKRVARNNNRTCPVCGSENLFLLFNKEAMPMYNLERHYNQDSALMARTGKVAFYFCKDCVFAFNSAFDDSEMDYSVDYESSRSHSRYFDIYLDKVSQDLDSVFGIPDKTIVEVGCGDGEFLKKLRGKYKFKGYGFDTSLATNQIAQFLDLQFVRGALYSWFTSILPDVILLRHILEHQKNPPFLFG